jgi:hypothetical protein
VKILVCWQTSWKVHYSSPCCCRRLKVTWWNIRTDINLVLLLFLVPEIKKREMRKKPWPEWGEKYRKHGSTLHSTEQFFWDHEQQAKLHANLTSSYTKILCNVTQRLGKITQKSKTETSWSFRVLFRRQGKYYPDKNM